MKTIKERVEITMDRIKANWSLEPVPWIVREAIEDLMEIFKEDVIKLIENKLNKTEDKINESSEEICLSMKAHLQILRDELKELKQKITGEDETRGDASDNNNIS